MDIVFTGSYSSPRVIVIPGLLAPSTEDPITPFWGEDLAFQFPDPGSNGTLRLVLKRNVEDQEPVLARDYTRTSNAGAITFTVTGEESRKWLTPGIFYWDLLFAVDTGSHVAYRPLARGLVTLEEGASSSEVPVSEATLAPLPMSVPRSYPSADLYLGEAAFVDAIFGFFKVPQDFALDCIGMSIAAQVPPAGADLQVKLVNYDTQVEMGQLCVLPANQSIADITFGAPLRMAGDSKWQAKIKQVGSTEPGEFLTVRLSFALVL